MAKGEDSHTEIARVRQKDGINVIFDRSSAAASRSRSRSKSSRRSSGSGRHRGRSNRRHRRCSSSSSSSRSSSRSRSHPRCHRPSSRCRCDNHRKHGRRSAPRRHMESSDSPSPSRHSRHRRNRSRSSRSGRTVSRFSQSPPRNHRSSSGSEYSENSVDLSIDDKGNPIMSANASIIQEDEKLYSPEIVESIQSAQAVESKVLRETWVRQDLEKTPSQSDEGELDDMFSLGMSLKRRTISFSINNAVLKPAAAAAASGAKVTSRMDSYESRKPYGHWMPVKSGHASRARRHTPAR